MSKRTQFLSSLFEAFDCQEISYCVSRNAGETFDNTGSDVDLVVSRGDLKRATTLCQQIASSHGYRLALRTRFTNLCLLFWSPTADFVRIDIEPGIRWKLFPVLTARELLKDRKREGRLFVPSATGEALVLAAKMAWTGKLSERYAARLSVLQHETGHFLDASKEVKQIIRLTCDGQCKQLRRYLITRTLVSPLRFWEMSRAVLDDVRRMIQRVLSPPGVHLCFRGTQPLNWEVLNSHLQMGFPSQKACKFTGKANLKQAFSSLFRGGLVLEQQMTQGADRPPRPTGLVRKFAAKQNRISIYRPGNGKIYLAHEASGLMVEHEDVSSSIEVQVADFIGEAMSQKYRIGNWHKKGLFIVLVGLDGAGKTTFARNLCSRLARGESGGTVRYHHWIPSLQKRSLPWPSFVETPRKSPASGAIHAMISAVRVLKNLTHAHLVYQLGIRRWVKRGEFAIVDRFIYNYWLDPVSLRYNGPKRLLNFAAIAMPKPDIVFSLEADADTLLSRKGELTRDQIEEQTRQLKLLPVEDCHKFVLDASLSPTAIVKQALDRLSEN